MFQSFSLYETAVKINKLIVTTNLLLQDQFQNLSLPHHVDIDG